MPPSLLAAGTTQGAAGLGSGKPVGSGNSQGGAASPWAAACAAPVPALGLCPCAGGAAVPPPPVPTPRVPSPGQSEDQPAQGPRWQLVAGCGHHPEGLRPVLRPPKSVPRWGGSAPVAPPWVVPPWSIPRGARCGPTSASLWIFLASGSFWALSCRHKRGARSWGGTAVGCHEGLGGAGVLTWARLWVRVRLFCSLLRKRMAPLVPRGDSGFLLTSADAAQRGRAGDAP